MAKRISKQNNAFSMICLQIVLISLGIFFALWSWWIAGFFLLCFFGTCALYTYDYKCSACGSSVGSSGKCRECGEELR